MACFHGLELRSVFGSVPGLSVRHPLSTAEHGVSRHPIGRPAPSLAGFKASRPGDGQHPANPISAFAYRRVAHDTSFCFARAVPVAQGTRSSARAKERLATFADRASTRQGQVACLSRQILPRARLSLPSLPPVLMAGGVFIWNCA
jgi:hypothetical protein